MKQGISLAVLSLTAALMTAGPTAGSVGEPAVTIAVSGGARASAGLDLGVKGGSVADKISIALDSSQSHYVVTSARPVLPPGAPCAQISTFQITCPVANFISFSATLSRGNDTFRVAPAIDIPGEIVGGRGEDLLRGGSGPETITGGSGSDRLLGRNSPDTLQGGDGGDVLNGGSGRDLLNGGKGQDLLRGGSGRDVEKQ
jgi:Ca2+-binding RTX toxin-like protein